METQDSPLNLAHQLERKAERALLAGQYEDAITHHQEAADSIEVALTLTSTQQALESLKLQQIRHLKQKDIIREKQRRAVLNAKKAADLVLKSSEAETNNRVKTDDNHSSEEVSVFRTVEECDSLLQFLNQRAVATGQQEHGQPSSLPHIRINEADDSSSQVNRVKKAVDDKLIIEELATHNRALRSHILQLLDELESKDQQLITYQQKYESLCDSVDNRQIYETLSDTVEHQQKYGALHDTLEHRHKCETQTFSGNMDHRQKCETFSNSMDHRQKCETLRDTVESQSGTQPSAAAPVLHDTQSSSLMESTEETLYNFPMPLNLDKLPALELPPLEMPQFDLDSLCSKSDKSDKILSDC